MHHNQQVIKVFVTPNIHTISSRAHKWSQAHRLSRTFLLKKHNENDEEKILSLYHCTNITLHCNVNNINYININYTT